MKKLVSLCLAFALAMSAVTVTNVANRETIVARTYENYTYVVLDDDTAEITNYAGHDTIVEIPEELEGLRVSAIGYGAFAECRGVEQVILPDTISRVDDNAFSKCTDLVSVTLPDSMKSIGDYVFKDCVSLRQVILPQGMVTIPKGMFSGCSSLEELTLPKTLTSISDTAFRGCTSLKELTIPENVKSIGGSAFKECKSLVEIHLPSGLKTIGSSVFTDCIALRRITLPETLNGIGQSAFQNCISLTSIELPSSIQTLGYSVFSGCSSLTDVVLPDSLTTIPESAFSSCSSLRSIEVPENVTSIGASAFAACTSLEEITLPASLKEIGAGAFGYCNSLITFTIPSGVKEVPANMFQYCDNLQYVVVPKTVTSIGDTAFAYCPSLESVIVPDSVASFGSRIFSNSENVVVTVAKNSKAYSYVVNNKVPYRLMEETLNLDTDELTLLVGDERQLNAVQKDGTVLDGQKISWSSNQPSVASVENGVVRAHAKGTAVITADKNGNKAECIVQVDDKEIPIESIRLNISETTEKINRTVNLKATVEPIKTTEDDTVTWTSSDPDIAIVNGTGNVVTKAPGTVTITASVSSGKKAECVIHVTSPVTAVSMNPSKPVTMEVGTRQEFRASVEPLDTTDPKTIVWSSSNPEYVSVDENGMVTALKKGSAYIYATAGSNENISSSCRVTVTETLVKPITSVELDQKEMSMVEGKEAQLHAIINPVDTTEDKTLTWSSDHEKIASVDDQGNVKALSPGQAVITVTTVNGKSASCVVTVEKKEVPITSVTLDKEKLEVTQGEVKKLEAVINPVDTTEDKTLTWSSDHEEIASVDDQGNVKALSPGQAVITVTTVNGKSASCLVTVKKKEVPITSVSLSMSEATIRSGNSIVLQAVILPENTTMEKEIVWSSENEAVATVENGKVTGVAEGTTRIVAKTVNGLTATCSIKVFDVSLDALKDSLQRAEGLSEEEYTLSSYEALKNAVKEGNKILEDTDASQKEIDQAQKALEAAMQNLEKRAAPALLSQLSSLVENCAQMDADFDEEEFAAMRELLHSAEDMLDREPADISDSEAAQMITALEAEKEALHKLSAEKEVQKSIEQAEKILAGDISGYEPESIAQLKEALRQAEELLKQQDASRDALKQAAAALQEAIASLETIPEKTDKSNLSAFIALVEEKSSEGYTAGSWNDFQKALNAANAVAEKEDASQAEVDDAYQMLVEAYFELQTAPSYAALDLEISLAQDILDHADVYYADTLNGLQEAVDRAKETRMDEYASQTEVNEAVKHLREVRILARRLPDTK